MKLNAGNKKYNIKHIPNVSGHPTLEISSPEPSSITSDSFTVVLPSCCMLPYNCNDVIYDVKGEVQVLSAKDDQLVIFRKIHRRYQSKYNAAMARGRLHGVHIWMQTKHLDC